MIVCVDMSALSEVYMNMPIKQVLMILSFCKLRGSLPKSGRLDFATKNTFPLIFVGEEALVGIY